MNQKVDSQAARLQHLVSRLSQLPRETEWVEFKENFFKPDDIGEYISALANGAALNGQDKGYLVWGVRDADHELVGTKVDPAAEKVGNEDFTHWVTRLLFPQVHFEFQTFQLEEKRFVVLTVNAAHTSPVRFKEAAYIRVGSYTKKLRDHVEHERRLWAAFNQVSFEENVAASDLEDYEVLDLIDYPSYFTLLKRRLPNGPQSILDDMAADSIVRRSQDSPNWDITNLGALLFAREISSFPALSRKALRIIQYEGSRRVRTIREQLGVKGYASGFLGAVRYLDELLPSVEVINDGIREEVRVYPQLAVRELLANALIHQDFTQTGNGPMVEVFEGRVEVTSPGQPLIDPSRFVDAPPRSRNEKLGALMRRAGICEERGSGWDKIGFEIEFRQLPAPKVEVTNGSTRVTLFGPKPFSEMDKTERLRAVYLHACLRYVGDEVLTNASLRERFGLENTSHVSRLISDAVEVGLLAPFDPSAGRKYMRYVPAWAVDAA